MQTNLKNIIIRKYGGASLSTPEKIIQISKEISKIYQKNKRIVLVVSAMGSTTTDLHLLAKSVSKTPSGRELDMLLSTGERVSGALMCMALESESVPAISFTGSQAGILTDSHHNNARIQGMNPFRLIDALEKNYVVVLAGYQGVDPISKDITTLGRGGTDTSAVALAKHLSAESVSMMKDVDGVCSADPKLIKNVKRIKHMSFNHLMDMTFWGANIIHYRASELAKNINMPIHIRPAHNNGDGTMINNDMLEKQGFLSINSHEHLLKIKTPKAEALQSLLNEYKIHTPRILHIENDNSSETIYLTTSKESLNTIEEIASKKSYSIENHFSTVSLTCTGNVDSDLIFQASQKLRQENIGYYQVWQSPLTITFLIEKKDLQIATTSLHSLITG